MLLILAAVLVVVWVVCFVLFHVAAFAIHLLILVAVVMFILHLLRGR